MFSSINEPLYCFEFLVVVFFVVFSSFQRVEISFDISLFEIVRVSNACEPRHEKTNKMTVRLTKTQISLGIRQSDQSLFCPHEESLDP